MYMINKISVSTLHSVSMIEINRLMLLTEIIPVYFHTQITSVEKQMKNSVMLTGVVQPLCFKRLLSHLFEIWNLQ
jgi:hypothetical protein